MATEYKTRISIFLLFFFGLEVLCIPIDNPFEGIGDAILEIGNAVQEEFEDLLPEFEEDKSKELTTGLLDWGLGLVDVIKSIIGNNGKNNQSQTGSDGKNDENQIGSDEKNTENQIGGDKKNDENQKGSDEKNIENPTGSDMKNDENQQGSDEKNNENQTGSDEKNTKDQTGGDKKNDESHTGSDKKSTENLTGTHGKNIENPTGSGNQIGRKADVFNIVYLIVVTIIPYRILL